MGQRTPELREHPSSLGSHSSKVGVTVPALTVKPSGLASYLYLSLTFHLFLNLQLRDGKVLVLLPASPVPVMEQ